MSNARKGNDAAVLEKRIKIKKSNTKSQRHFSQMTKGLNGQKTNAKKSNIHEVKTAKIQKAKIQNRKRSENV